MSRLEMCIRSFFLFPGLLVLHICEAMREASPRHASQPALLPLLMRQVLPSRGREPASFAAFLYGSALACIDTRLT